MHLEIFIDFTLIGANRQDRSRDMNIENILFFLDSLSPFFSEKYIRLSKTEKLAFVTNIWNATAWSLVFILRTFLKLGFLNTMYVIKLKEILQLAQVPMMKTSKKKHWTCHFSSPLPWKYCFSKPTSLIHSDLSTSKSLWKTLGLPVQVPCETVSSSIFPSLVSAGARVAMSSTHCTPWLTKSGAKSCCLVCLRRSETSLRPLVVWANPLWDH